MKNFDLLQFEKALPAPSNISR